MPDITSPKKGSPITARWAAEIAKAINELKRALKQRPHSKDDGRPFKPIYNLFIKQGSAPNKFQVTPGYVNGVMPKLATVLLNEDPAPEFEITEITSVIKQVWIKCVGIFVEGAGTPDDYTVTIEIAESIPSGTDITSSGFTSFYLLGTVEVVENIPDPITYDIVNINATGGNYIVDSFGLYNIWGKA